MKALLTIACLFTLAACQPQPIQPAPELADDEPVSWYSEQPGQGPLLWYDPAAWQIYGTPVGGYVEDTTRVQVDSTYETGWN
ncbi:hypothetical protein [Spirosoma sp. 209]|uniref:hypothetical protein n=1 Tax=Spirosoma sp. 209 TaxID=1955701 RepID=UPI00098D60E2|nr:hypothetical protein [Spirosoma sp. 209]